jgi:hypothetical protein
MPERTCEPNFKGPAVKKAAKGVRTQRAGTPAALKRKATKLWGEFIHERDQVCQVCGRPDGKLDAHHIMVRQFNATRSWEPNGILVCFQDHQKLHSDPFWAVQFYTARFGVDGYEALRRKAYDGTGGTYGAPFWRGEVARLERALGYRA